MRFTCGWIGRLESADPFNPFAIGMAYGKALLFTIRPRMQRQMHLLPVSRPFKADTGKRAFMVCIRACPTHGCMNLCTVAFHQVLHDHRMQHHATLAGLLASGGVAAWVGGAPVLRGAWRVGFWGARAMAARSSVRTLVVLLIRGRGGFYQSLATGA